MVNVGTGNLLVQDDDMSVPHKGIALAFRRTYNSQSPAVVVGNFVQWRSLYGNGWTNTFDAHLVRMSLGHLSIYDIDGARYDYVANNVNDGSQGYYTTNPGQHAILTYDGGCGFMWTKKSGTVYYFYAGNPSASCAAMGSFGSGTLGGYAGRLYQIIGRNRNTYITFAYSWDNGDASATGKVSQITATTESGMSATLTFGDVNGQRLLQQITYPDGATSVSYGYDAQGNLASVSHPPNNSGGIRPQQTYGYQTLGSDYVLQWAASPRWNAGCASTCGTDGAGLIFGFAGSAAISSTVSWDAHYGVVNPTIADGSSSTALQAAYSTNAYNFLNEFYTTGTAAPTYRDSDGHMTNWIVDSLGRPTQTQVCSASSNQGQQCTGSWLVSNETWDTSNNRVSDMDPRGAQTDYAYDANGNAIAVAQPAPSPGASRPTALYSYDTNNNVIAYCDPVATHASVPNGDWTTPPAASDTLCPQSSFATRIQWTTPTYQGFGELISITTPATASASNGYQKTFSYDQSRQGGTDYGLPTTVAGASVTQSIDSATPTRQPKQDLWYDANGNVVCYGTGVGQWLLTYDSLERLTYAADPDDGSSGPGACVKTGFQPGWNTMTHMTYYADGTVASKQTASQVANGTATTFTYDADGDESTETHHYGCLSVSSCAGGVTKKWYDGTDRLVEVQLPYDGGDVQGYPWSTRYIYDLSKSGTTSYNGLALKGYGNLVATQELLSGTVWQPAFAAVYPPSSAAWTDVRATSFDGLDRSLNSYEAAFGNTPKEAYVYDGQGQSGLLTSLTRATGEVASYAYDLDGRRTGITYQADGGVTPALQFGFDADSRVTSQSSSVLGAETFTFDPAGELTSVTEPASIGGGTISYGYYADGLRANAAYSDTTQSFPSALSYAYRADGRREQLMLANGTSFTWNYTAAGREQTQSDPLTGSNVSPQAYYTVGKQEKLFYPATVTYGPWTQSYDTNGRVNRVTLPTSFSTYSFSQYDLEDQVAEQTVSTYGPPLVGSPFTTQCLASNIRNEKIPFRPLSPCNNSPAMPQMLNGIGVSSPTIICRISGGSSCPTTQDWTIDARSGMQLHNTAVATNTNLTLGSIYTYDASGRLTQDVESEQETINYNSGNVSPGTFSASWCPTYEVTPQNTSVTCAANGSRQKTYDAENRLRTETFSWANEYPATAFTTSYGALVNGSYWEDANRTSSPAQPATIQAVDYGASSHPMRFSLYHPDLYANQSAQYQTRAWLWDGNDRFLECHLSGSTCQSPRLSIEGLGEYDPVHGTLIRVDDRNLYGTVVMHHTATSFTGWTESPNLPRNQAPTAPCAAAPPDSVNDVDGLPHDTCGRATDGKLSADGWTLGYETWQGVRTFDTAINQWNSPDAFAGDVHDPMSQKPFMWNRNNPYQYSDPSGYYWQYIDPSLRGALEILMMSPTFSARFKAIARDKHPFRVSVRLRPEMIRVASVGATTEPDTITNGSGTALLGASIYVRPGMPRDLVIEDLAHEIGGHAYGDITDLTRELDDSKDYYSQPREINAYSIGDRIMKELNAIGEKSQKSSIDGQFDEQFSQMRSAVR